MIPGRAILALGTLAVLLGACARATVIAPEYVSSSYDPFIVGSMAKYGVVPTEVYGNPFAVSKEQLDGAITGAVTGANFGPPLTFSTTPPADIASPYSLIVLFDPAPNAKANRICTDRAQPTAPTEAGVKAMIVICSSDYRISSAVASNGSVTGPDDPAFRQLLQQAMAILLPPHREDVNSPMFSG